MHLSIHDREVAHTFHDKKLNKVVLVFAIDGINLSQNSGVILKIAISIPV